VLKNSSVEECMMVDIDGDVVQMCRDHMPKHSAGAFEDKRTKLVIDDAKAELEKCPDGYFDVLIMDLSDPLDGGPCYQLYTTSFYEMCKSKMAPGGIFVTQSGCAGIHDCHEGVFTAINNTLKQVFPKVMPYTSYVPSFSSEWGFNMAFKDESVNTDQIFGQLDANIEKMGLAGKLKWYDQITHQRMVSLPKEVRALLSAEKRVMTVENPLFMNDQELRSGVFEQK
jgi:thermospermine synthase